VADEAREEQWVGVAEISALRPGSVRKVEVQGISLAVACTTSGIFVLDDACAHEGSSLGEGSLDGTTLKCAAHGWEFACASGACLTDGAFQQTRYESRLEGGKLQVLLPVARAGSSASAESAASKTSPIEAWKAAKHGLDVWPDVLSHAERSTPMAKIDPTDLERMKWYGFFYRKANDHGRYMCRIRLPGCAMTTEQAKVISYLAYESGYGLVDVTTRGNVQLQGLTIDRLPAVRSALERVGLTAQQSGHDNVRNITSHPWSGIDPQELIDTRGLAEAIQDRLIGDRELSDLPRKLNVALVGRSDPESHAWTQDISFVAVRGPGGDTGFQLLLGGTQGKTPCLAWHIPVFVLPEEVLGVTIATIGTFRDLGYRTARNKVRLRFLIERIGAEGMLREIETRLGHALMPFARPVPRPHRDENFMGWFRQKQEGLWALGVNAPLGRLTTYEFEGLALVARQFGSESLRTTCDQNIVIPDIPEAARQEAEYAIARHGLTFEPDAASRNTVACTGKQFCSIAVTETKGYAYQLIEELRRRKVQTHGIKIHMSGCPSSCAMSFTADIGLMGAKVRRGLRVFDAFDLYLGGGIGSDVRMAKLYQRGVPFGELAEVVEKLVAEFHLHRTTGQTFSEYWSLKLDEHTLSPLAELPRWQCTQCSYLHVGEYPPAFCPRCAAIRSKFDPAPEEGEQSSPPVAARVAGEAKPGGRRVLIVGGSIAGHTAAQVARSEDPDAQVTLLTDEVHSFYNRLNLTRFLAGEVERDALFEYEPRWYEQRRIEVRTETRVIGIDPMGKSVLLDEGRELPYDALILAHGSAGLAPPFHREDLEGLYLLRTLRDVESILARVAEGTRVAFVGGGVLGIEAALGVARRGGRATLLEWMPRLMPRQLDTEAAELLAAKVREAGVEVSVGSGVEAIRGSAAAEGLTLQDGRQIDADLVVLSTGIRPNIDWVKRSGIRCERGVCVDDRMATSAPDVYAAGDVAEWNGRVVGLWTNAIEQAKVAAMNASGKFGFFEGFLPVTQLKCIDTPVLSIGEILEEGGDVTSHVERDAAAGTYRRVIRRAGVPVGALLVGTTSGSGDLLSLVQKGVELERLEQKLMPAPVSA
jgi:ferredoxin-nitrite reductase